MSFSRISSAALCGMEVIPVQVEADVSSGLPLFHMVGYLSAEVREAGERVRTAIQNSGFSFPVRRIVINLSPANLRKRGTAYDLPIALSVLTAVGELEKGCLENVTAVGELGLNGNIRGIRGVFPIADRAKKEGAASLIVPAENEPEARLVEGIPIFGASNLKALCQELRKAPYPIGKAGREERRGARAEESRSEEDFSDIRGQQAAKRAAEVAVAGRHNLLMVGPPGGGKSMIARRIPTILPPLTPSERIQLTKIYSIAGLLKPEQPLITRRPFREVHQTLTRTSLIGGGTWPKPGELTLASGGVLFMDELAELGRPVLEALRQPLEERVVRITRSQGTYEFPADVMLVAATNLCPCGYYPDLNRCRCSPFQIRQYQSRISHPFLGRMDICVEVSEVAYEDLSGNRETEDSESVRKRVEAARIRQMERWGEGEPRFNAELSGKELAACCRLGKWEEKMMSQAFDRLALNARTYYKVLKVARTIADLEGEEQIGMPHLQEALIYRSVDCRYWGETDGKNG